MKVEVSMYVVVKSFNGKIEKLGAYDTPAEARWVMEMEVDKFLDTNYGTKMDSADLTSDAYSEIIVDKDSKVPRCIFQVFEI